MRSQDEFAADLGSIPRFCCLGGIFRHLIEVILEIGRAGGAIRSDYFNVVSGFEECLAQ